MSSRKTLLVGAAVLAMALAIGAVFDAGTVEGALLYALVAGSAAPGGAVVLLLVGDLTGGRWTSPVRDRLVPLARLLPVFSLLFLAIAFDLPAVFPWTTDFSVRTSYLNQPAFIARGIAIFLIWSAAAWRAVGTSGRPLTAGLALLTYTVATLIAATDWGMSLTPHWSSTTYGVSLEISQLGAALAVVLLGAQVDEGVRDDVAKLLLATVLALNYLDFMQFLVIWSGNLPDRVDYYVSRRVTGLGWVEIVTLIVGAAVPFICLLTAPSRRSSSVTGVAACGFLIGLALHFAWELLAGATGLSVVAAVGAIAMTVLMLAASITQSPRVARVRVQRG